MEGFDIDDPQALAQMLCLTDHTGGTFRSAANAEELGAALTAGGMVEVTSTGPDDHGDYLIAGPFGANDASYLHRQG
ncbi:hypothetical protein OEZ49_21395 [Ruegeria sp. WL0004]|uniref:YCII-related domain-containing protein n=1 Tax=Ruegeria marisflavi TaxID=2984152 RepID=A0ABT2WWQ1_9RHOB|nr:hypothetical protein [Ruegeria sp. WL0004]MCU9840316.1 hypothetical protein [Ruegeria sp. WL0004]